MSGWTWDETLFAGAARYYAVGRAAYPPELAEKLVAALHLDGTGLLVDVGCGPGSIALQLAPGSTPTPGVLATVTAATGFESDTTPVRRRRARDLSEYESSP